MNSGTTPRGKCPFFSPFGSSKHQRTGSVCVSHHLLITRTEPWVFIKLSVQNKVVHMELSFHLSFQLSHSLGVHGGYHHGIPRYDHGGFSPIPLSLNPAVVPTVTYEYLFYLPSSERLRPLAQWNTQGLLSGYCTTGTVGHWLQPKIWIRLVPSSGIRLENQALHTG
jgi:hypothetical protein